MNFKNEKGFVNGESDTVIMEVDTATEYGIPVGYQLTVMTKEECVDEAFKKYKYRRDFVSKL